MRIVAEEDRASLPSANATVITKSTRKVMMSFHDFLLFFDLFLFDSFIYKPLLAFV